MRYAFPLPDGTVVVSSDAEFVSRLCTARGIDKSLVVSTDDSHEATVLRNQSKLDIDNLANEVYSVYVQSAGLLKEYQQAEEDAKAYVSNPTVVPQSVSSWANPKGWTAEQAAQDILIAAGKLRYIMGKIREVRLGYKTAIDLAPGIAEINSLTNVGKAILTRLKG